MGTATATAATPGMAPAAGQAALTPPELDVLTLPFVEASLAAMRAHGVDLRQPLPNHHVLELDDPAQAPQLLALLRLAGFTGVQQPHRLEHGSRAVGVVVVQRLTPADAPRIVAEGRQLRAMLAGLPGARYATWMPVSR